MTQEKAEEIARDFRKLCEKHNLVNTLLITKPRALYEVPWTLNLKLDKCIRMGYAAPIEIEITHAPQRFLSKT